MGDSYADFLERAIRRSGRDIDALVDAVDMVLDDMGKDGKECCMASKAYLRVAFEPFRASRLIPDEFIMSLHEAKLLTGGSDQGQSL